MTAMKASRSIWKRSALRFITTILATYFLLISARSTTSAQSLLASDQTKPAGGRPKSTEVGFFELMESGGDATLDLFRPSGHRQSVGSPEFNSQASPRDTVMTFVEAMNHVVQGRDEPWPRALAALPARTEDERQVAKDLLSVFDRLPELSPGSIPGEKMVDPNWIDRVPGRSG